MGKDKFQRFSGPSFFFNFLIFFFFQAKELFQSHSISTQKNTFFVAIYLDIAFMGEWCLDIRFQYKMYQYHIFQY